MSNVYILGGYQTDFADNWQREGKTLYQGMREAVAGALTAAHIDAADIEVAHVGNFTGELFCRQGHLGGFVASILAELGAPAHQGVPAMRHEAACASGSMALVAAAADIEAGRYDLACVIGVEQMRNVSGAEAAEHLGAAAWTGREGLGVRYLWPHMFARIADEYDRRYGLRYEHLMGLARIFFDNAKRNPNAQTRRWTFTGQSFTEDDVHNPVIEGRLRRHDCAQITDGAAALLLASPSFAERYARAHGVALESLPRILGWGHRTAPMLLEDKLQASLGAPLMFPHVRHTLEDAWRRARIGGIEAVDAVELHDCFSITAYVLIEHLGITSPGQAWRAIESGEIGIGGHIPINPSGGLMGLGHPVGATGVRMALDAYKQVTGTAGAYQVEGARTVQTLNIGGSTTTVASLIIGY